MNGRFFLTLYYTNSIGRWLKNFFLAVEPIFYIFSCKSPLDSVKLGFLFQYDYYADDSQRGAGQQEPEGWIRSVAGSGIPGLGGLTGFAGTFTFFGRRPAGCPFPTFSNFTKS